MRTITITRSLVATLRFEPTRSGFRHLATLHRNGHLVASAKQCWVNRTWEPFEFSAVLQNLMAASSLSAYERRAFVKKTGIKHHDIHA